MKLTAAAKKAFMYIIKVLGPKEHIPVYDEIPPQPTPEPESEKEDE